ncbi:MAG: hypothetical protein IJJ28_07655, partial [Lentisphaeria bacterium]|nr:hypothetical protein [Lentisphaeria bacterium]
TLLLAALYLRRLYLERDATAKAVAVLWFAMTVLSGLNIRLLPYYLKDDYAGAVREARRLSRGGPILFQGDRITFGYYGLHGAFPDAVRTENANVNISNVDASELKAQYGSMPCTVILSEKPEFDRHGLCRTFRPGEGSAVNSFRILPPAGGAPTAQ